MKIFTLDIGGSSVKHGWFNSGSGKLIESSMPRILLSKTFDELKKIVIELTRSAFKENPGTTHIAISTTGGVSESGIVLNAGHFSGYANIDWSQILKDEVHGVQSVTTVNDGQASAWAEYSALEQKPMGFIHLVIGTGIGGAIIMGDRLFYGTGGFAGYVGHVKVGISDVVCSCGKTGCVETFSAAPAIARGFTMQLRNNQQFAFKDVLNALAVGDPAAKVAVIDAASMLGVAVSTMMNLLNPGAITIGGGVIEAFEMNGVNVYFDTLKASALDNAHKRVIPGTLIKKAYYGNSGGMTGAALLAQLSLLSR